MKEPPVLAALGAALESWRGLLDEITTADLTLTTGNPGWDVGHLINHAIGITAKFTAFAAGATTRPRTPHGDLIGTDHRVAWNDVADRSLAAWRHTDLRRSCDLPFGTFTARQAAGINLFDLLAHGWDLQQATGAPFSCPDHVWETGLHAARSVIAQRRDPRHYAPPIPAPPEAPARTRLLRYLGRTGSISLPVGPGVSDSAGLAAR